MLEAADDVTQGATKGNSGIVHAGYDDKPGTVKSKYCWPGNQLFPQLDRELHFGFEKNGSLVVAKGEEDEAILEELMQRGYKNGVKNCRIIGRDELFEKEPYIHPDATAALYSPDAGTITPYEYTIALAENAVDNGVEVRIRREVVSIDQVEEGGQFVIKVKHWEPAHIAKRMCGSYGKLYKTLTVALVLAFAEPFSYTKIPETISQLKFDVFATMAVIVGTTIVTIALFATGKKDSKTVEWQYEPSKGTVTALRRRKQFEHSTS